MKVLFLVLAFTLVATDALPTRTRSTRLQELAATLKGSQVIPTGTPEYDEVRNTFDDVLSVIDDVMLSLYDQGNSYLSMTESGKSIQAEYGGIVFVQLNLMESDLLDVMLSLYALGSFQEVVNASKGAWDDAKLRWSFMTRIAQNLVKYEAPDIYEGFEKILVRKQNAWYEAVVPMDEVLAKYLPEN